MATPMPPPIPSQPASSQAAVTDEDLRFSSPGDATKSLIEDFNYWSGKLTDSSFALSLALIGANWAVFGSVTSLLENLWAKLSILFVILSLALSLIGSWYMAELHRRRFEYAEADVPRWRREFNDTMGKINPWPFTSGIENAGSLLRWFRMLLPLVAGAFFLIGLLITPAAGTKPHG